MKKSYLLFFTIISYMGLQAQVLNPSFENWTTKQNEIEVNGSTSFNGFPVTYSIDDPQFTYNEIVDWSSLNQLTPTASVEDLLTNSTTYEQIRDTTDFVDGSKGLFIESREIEITVQTGFGAIPFANVGPGIVISGEFVLDIEQFAEEVIQGTGLNSLNPFIINGTGQAIDFRPKTLYGSYKYNGLSGDSALIFSGVIKNREMVAYTITRLPNTNTWTNFELDYEYLNCDMPDTIVTFLGSSNLSASFDAMGNFTVADDYTGVAGSALFIDDLSLDTFDVNSFPPLANNDTSNIVEGQVALNPVLLNDEFCGGTATSPVINTITINGTTSVTANDELEFTPNLGYTGTQAIEYYVCNTLALCDTAVWYVTVSPIVPCIANDDTRSLNVNESVIFDATLNDDDCGSTPVIVVSPLNGTADVESNGDISYSPVTGFEGTDSLSYVVCSLNNPAQCDTATVVYTVFPSTGVKEIPASLISIAPNPAKDFATIKLNGNYINTKVEVYNMLGNKTYSGNFDNSIQLNTKNYSNGVYLIQLENELGRAVRKLVIAK